ncbi:hypothetical protein [Paracoccus beibuensis]|uniref:hypothetical protein n=1 Tax=Paracoccus beibuensis TaxID=547602 RepID=UPI0022405105|nr:hypothetical protein [Paracoccus beibuensis]
MLRFASPTVSTISAPKPKVGPKNPDQVFRVAKGECSKAKGEVFAKVAEFMLIPAPSKKYFKFKERLVKVGGRERDFAPIIKAERERLYA